MNYLIKIYAEYEELFGSGLFYYFSFKFIVIDQNVEKILNIRVAS